MIRLFCSNYLWHRKFIYMPTSICRLQITKTTRSSWDQSLQTWQRGRVGSVGFGSALILSEKLRPILTLNLAKRPNNNDEAQTHKMDSHHFVSQSFRKLCKIFTRIETRTFGDVGTLCHVINVSFSELLRELY